MGGLPRTHDVISGLGKRPHLPTEEKDVWRLSGSLSGGQAAAVPVSGAVGQPGCPAVSQGRQGSRGCIPGTPGESGLVFCGGI